MNLPHAVRALPVTGSHRPDLHSQMAQLRYEHRAMHRRLPVLVFFWVLFPSLLLMLWLSGLCLYLVLTAIVTLAALYL